VCGAQELQGLQEPTDKLDLPVLYVRCGYSFASLVSLEGRLKAASAGEVETDCKALRMVLAAAKELHNPGVRRSGHYSRVTPATVLQSLEGGGMVLLPYARRYLRTWQHRRYCGCAVL
jgi:hypothetical protein